MVGQLLAFHKSQKEPIKFLHLKRIINCDLQKKTENGYIVGSDQKDKLSCDKQLGYLALPQT